MTFAQFWVWALDSLFSRGTGWRMESLPDSLAALLAPSENALALYTRCKSEPLATSIPGVESLRPGEPLEVIGSSPAGCA